MTTHYNKHTSKQQPFPATTAINEQPQRTNPNNINMSSEAIIPSEFNVENVSYSPIKPQAKGSVVNVLYNGRTLYLQTPLMNTFGISRHEETGKYTLALRFSTNGVNETEVMQFEQVMTNLRNKIRDDLVDKHYDTWLRGGNTNVAAWKDFTRDVRGLMVDQKMGNTFLRKSAASGKDYPPIMNVNVNKQGNTEDLNVDVYMLDDNNRILMNEHGEFLRFNAKDHLLFTPKDDIRSRPRVYCMFNVSIWIVNTNVYLSPRVKQILIQPVKGGSQKLQFNPRGFLGDIPESSGSRSYQNEEDDEEDDAPMPARRM